jgi:hypothetical protein
MMLLIIFFVIETLLLNNNYEMNNQGLNIKKDTLKSVMYHDVSLSTFMMTYRVWNKSNTTSSGAEPAYPSGATEFTP